MDFASELKQLPRQHDFFVGIDSDGCVFDTMEIKHKECFCPAFIKHFHQQAASKYARQVWEFVNLYSKTRGCNRFLAVQRCLQLVKEWPVFAERNINTMDLPSLNKWIEEETKLGNPALEAKVAATNDEQLRDLLEWSTEVNARIAEMVHGIPPFPPVVSSLSKLHGRADMIVVSQTPYDALKREWEEHGIDTYVNFIAGQEAGTKTEHLKFAADGKYEPERVLMLGDAPGDLRAARANNALFFPIIPGDEEASWQRFHDEGVDRFLDGSYAGKYQDGLLEDFDKALPELPPWHKK
mgnify:CR=1 FL=1